MKRNKYYTFRIYPNKEQEVLLNMTFGCVRFIYNKMLESALDLTELNLANEAHTPYEMLSYESDELKDGTRNTSLSTLKHKNQVN